MKKPKLPELHKLPEWEERKQRTALTLLFGGVVFSIFLLVVMVSMAIVVLLVHNEVLSLPAQTIDKQSVYAVLWWMALSSLLMGAILAVIAGLYLLRPINTIINAMNALAAGNFKTRIHFGTVFARHPTVRELTDSFNTMASELEGTELLRSDFVNNFSHEFKTPIVSIAGFAALLRRGHLSTKEKQEYLDIIEEESKRLADMSTNVLNLTRIENQTILTHTQTFNLSEQLRNSVLLLEQKWEKKNLEINLELEELHIVGDEDLLRQVWVNLLDNAIKFTPEGGTVDMKLYADGDKLVVSVGNTGSTIPGDKMDHIWSKFYQADSSRSTEGNGIGLAIVKSVVKLHGGETAVQSKDGYTRFTVSLPKRTTV